MRAPPGRQRIQWFKREFDDGALVLSPKFQRRGVWDEFQESYLIDSILNGLPIPEVYMRVLTTGSGKTTYEVVDGQQRITAILEFCGGELTLSGPDVSSDLQGVAFEDLDEDVRKEFWQYEIATRELQDATDGEIRDIFRRLNLNAVVLNDPELRHARLSGRFIKLVEELAEDTWWLEHGITSLREIRRMEDVEFVSELLVGLMAGPQDKKKTLDDFYEEYDKAFPDRETWKKQFLATRDLMGSVLSDADIKRWRGKSEFYTLFLLFGELLESGTKRLTDKKRTALRQTLMAFKAKADQARRSDNDQKMPHHVLEYADAVSRAASDLGRRNVRLKVLRAVIAPVLGKQTS